VTSGVATEVTGNEMVGAVPTAEVVPIVNIHLKNTVLPICIYVPTELPLPSVKFVNVGVQLCHACIANLALVTLASAMLAVTTALSASFALVTASSARLAALMLPLNSLYRVSKLELISELEIVVLPLNVFGLFTIEILLSSFFVLMSFYHSCFNCLMVLVSSSDFFLALYS